MKNHITCNISGKHQAFRPGFMLAALLGIGLAIGFPLRTQAQEGGQNPTPQCETCTNCCPSLDPAVKPKIEPEEFKCANADEVEKPTVTPPSYCPGQKNGNAVTYTVGDVRWVPPIPDKFDESYGEEFTSDAYVSITSSDETDCPHPEDYHIGKCTWHILRSKWTPEVGAVYSFEASEMEKINDLLHKVPGFGAISVSAEGEVNITAKKRDCCKDDVVQKWGQKEVKIEGTIGVKLKDIPVPIPGLPAGTKEFKFSALGVTYTVMVQIGVFAGGDFSVHGVGGKRTDACGKENCIFWSITGAPHVTFGPKLEAIFCYKGWTKEKCYGLTATGTAEASFEFGGGHNVEKCDDKYNFFGKAKGVDLKIDIAFDVATFIHKHFTLVIPLYGDQEEN